jgi:UDP-N-acetylglucosamine diphosphorylase / glucose-1-phosphate thymidylyltransferase / UDP-N-acetylgalactosamine diphosphorylase / glucosamine-1-phosphate N-acetyltransferase / galactosamine-1-phosphate N-acetyltransferase
MTMRDGEDTLEAKLKPEYFFDLSNFEHKELFEGKNYVWEALIALPAYMEKIVPHKLAEYDFRDDSTARIHETAVIGPEVYIGKGTVVGPYAVIEGPTIIGDNNIIQNKAHIRGNVVTGPHTRIGNTEVVNSILLGGIGPKKDQMSHFAHRNYIGYSIMGKGVILGAAVTTASLRGDWKPINVYVEGKKYETGLGQFGVVMGDNSFTGCGLTLNPGTLIGKDCFIHNIHHLKSGFIPSNREVRNKDLSYDIKDRNL